MYFGADLVDVLTGEHNRNVMYGSFMAVGFTVFHSQKWQVEKDYTDEAVFSTVNACTPVILATNILKLLRYFRRLRYLDDICKIEYF